MLVNTYTTLDDVRRLLRAKPPAGRLRFSESYSHLMASTDNTGTIQLAGMRISDEYADVASYEIQFGGDSTSFVMKKVDRETNTNLIVGSGVKQVNFASSDGFFQIDSTSWLGWSFPGDVVVLNTNSHISKYDASAFIMDAERFVDANLESRIRFELISESNLVFPLDSTSVVPKSVALATMNIAAYMMYKAVYLDQINTETKENYTNDFMRTGMGLLDNFVDKWNKSYNTSVIIEGKPCDDIDAFAHVLGAPLVTSSWPFVVAYRGPPGAAGAPGPGYTSEVRVPTGAVDGVNVNFSVPHNYIAGSLRYILNGVLQNGIPGFTVTETGPNTFSVSSAPIVGDAVVVEYNR